VNVRTTAATVVRILAQLRHDPRTVVLLLAVPALLLTLLRYMFDAPGASATFDRVALVVLGLFPFTVMFLVTSIAMLRERRSGTLERLLTTPMGRLDLLLGYGTAFGLVAVVQAAVVTTAAFGVFGVQAAGSVWWAGLIAVLTALLGTALGLLCSAFARTEFQAVQFLPVVVLPQTLLCGLFVARDAMAGWLQGLSSALPLTYAVEALQQVGARTDVTATLVLDAGVVAGSVLLALGLAAATLRRRTP
jgi:ABC-2 type transport system permease protein